MIGMAIPSCVHEIPPLILSHSLLGYSKGQLSSSAEAIKEYFNYQEPM